VKPTGNQDRAAGEAGRRERRRALLSTISAIGAVQLPTQWARPVVDHVLLPAHAQLSPGALEDCAATCTQVAVINRTINTAATPPEVTNAFTVEVTCARDPLGDTVSDSSSSSESFTAELIPIETSGLTSFSISLAGADLCAGDVSELITIVDLA